MAFYYIKGIFFFLPLAKYFVLILPPLALQTDKFMLIDPKQPFNLGYLTYLRSPQVAADPWFLPNEKVGRQTFAVCSKHSASHIKL